MLAGVLFILQLALLGFFLYFAFFNYLYTFASFFYKKPKQVKPSGKHVAIVIVSFNEKEVLLNTLEACEKINYPNKTIILGDDSNDGETLPLLKEWFKSRGARKVPYHHVDKHHKDAEIYQTKDKSHVLFHRLNNIGFKAGNLKEIEIFMQRHKIDYMYLLDADWKPDPEIINETLAVLEADNELGFVQTKREHYNRRQGPIQLASSLSEEAAYTVDLVGRHVLGHPILFTGCCTLFDNKKMAEVGGFHPGHLTEDIDLTNRFYLHGYKAAYLPYISNQGEVVLSYKSIIKQQNRWAQGSARTLKEYFFKILFARKLSWIQSLSLLRQDMYYATALGIELSLLLAIISVSWIGFFPESFQANLYVLYMHNISVPFTVLLIAALLSNFVPLIVSIFRQKHYKEIPFILFSNWLFWSLIHTYFWANIKGMLGLDNQWFRTPKSSGKQIKDKTKRSRRNWIINFATFCVFLFIYGMEWHIYGWINPYAFFWLPAMAVSVAVS